MKSFSGKMMLAAACAGLMISLTAGSALAGDRDGHRGGSRDRGGHYDRDHRGWSSHYDRHDRGFYRPYHYGYVGGYSPVYVEAAAYYPEPEVEYVAPAPVVQYVYPAPVCRERVVVVRHAYRSGWGVGFYYGR